MVAIVLGMALGLPGSDAGWRPLPGGGVEYIIQIAPSELELFQKYGLEGDVRPDLRDIRSYRVVVGNDVLPRQDPPKPRPTAPRPSTPSGWDFATAYSAQRSQSSGFQPFAALAALWDRYPFAGETAKPPPKETSTEPPASWGPFTAIVVALLGSLGGNLYMGWITWDTRARYHALVRRRKRADHDARENADDSDED